MLWDITKLRFTWEHKCPTQSCLAVNGRVPRVCVTSTFNHLTIFWSSCVKKGLIWCQNDCIYCYLHHMCIRRRCIACLDCSSCGSDVKSNVEHTLFICLSGSVLFERHTWKVQIHTLVYWHKAVVCMCCTETLNYYCCNLKKKKKGR